ncbi:hypothetical protein B6A27_07220 [Anoxybacillus sp. UARK-01]|nr:hypothetical protein B6A27_07220 [Anoxybacillus sp. UARK-01]
MAIMSSAFQRLNMDKKDHVASKIKAFCFIWAMLFDQWLKMMEKTQKQQSYCMNGVEASFK